MSNTLNKIVGGALTVAQFLILGVMMGYVLLGFLTPGV